MTTVKETEVEVKIIEIDVEEVLDVLRSMEHEYVFDGTIQTYDYKTSEDGKSFIRLRHLSNWNGADEYCIIYKDGKPSDSFAKFAVEHKLVDICHSITIFHYWRNFFNLALPLIHDSNKHRMSFQIGEFRVDIDDYGVIPPFMEIEGPDVDSIKRFVQEFMPWFDGEEGHMKNWGTKELFEHYGIAMN